MMRTLSTVGVVTAVDYPEIDLVNLENTHGWVRKVKPDVIVNAAAYTDVDGAENNLEIAHAINAVAPGVLASEAQATGAALVHYSTDFVFDGEKPEPYLEGDPTNPINAYGKTKLAGELAIEAVGGPAITLRTAWVYSTRRPSFVTKVLGWAREYPELRIVTDQIGSPTWCRMLAAVTAQLVAQAGARPGSWFQERRGIYHLAGLGGTSRYDWAQAILESDPKKSEQVVKTVFRARSSEFPTPAIRPVYTVLNCDKFTNVFGLGLPPWEEALRMALEEN